MLLCGSLCGKQVAITHVFRFPSLRQTANRANELCLSRYGISFPSPGWICQKRLSEAQTAAVWNLSFPSPSPTCNQC